MLAAIELRHVGPKVEKEERVARRYWLGALALVLALAHPALAQGTKKPASFNVLEAASVQAVQAKAQAWLKEVSNNNAAKLQQCEAIWKKTDRSVLDRLADTFVLGNASAAQIVNQARDPQAPAPLAIPDVLTDAKQSAFLRANLSLVYARWLSIRHVYEEALDVLRTITPEQVVDPATYLFHRAICEHQLLLKDDAIRTANRLIYDAVDSPERYKAVGALILLDMQTWKGKDLGSIARKMDSSARRLDLARGGPQTQKIQKDILDRLDELIKEMENKAKQGDSNGGS
jgi:hypothetical protein